VDSIGLLGIGKPALSPRDGKEEDATNAIRTMRNAVNAKNAYWTVAQNIADISKLLLPSLNCRAPSFSVVRSPNRSSLSFGSSGLSKAQLVVPIRNCITAHTLQMLPK